MTIIHRNVSMTQQVQQAIRRLESVKVSAVPSAIARSINAVGVVSERRTAQDVAKSEKIKQRAIKQRISPIKKASQSSPNRRVKIKRHDIAASAIGKPRQTRKGVSVGKHRFGGAFVADGSKGFGKYIRSQHRQSDRKAYYDTRLTTEQVLQRTRKDRHPLEVVKVSIEKPLTNTYERNVRRAYTQNLAPELTKNLARELSKINRVL